MLPVPWVFLFPGSNSVQLGSTHWDVLFYLSHPSFSKKVAHVFNWVVFSALFLARKVWVQRPLHFMLSLSLMLQYRKKIAFKNLRVPYTSILNYEPLFRQKPHPFVFWDRLFSTLGHLWGCSWIYLEILLSPKKGSTWHTLKSFWDLNKRT